MKSIDARCSVVACPAPSTAFARGRVCGRIAAQLAMAAVTSHGGEIRREKTGTPPVPRTIRAPGLPFSPRILPNRPSGAHPGPELSFDSWHPDSGGPTCRHSRRCFGSARQCAIATSCIAASWLSAIMSISRSWSAIPGSTPAFLSVSLRRNIDMIR